MRVSLLVLWLLLAVIGCAPKREAPPPEPPRAVSRLTWNYHAPAPESFVVQRRLEGKEWEDLATLPGATGADLSYTDASLTPGRTEVVVHYRVQAVIGGQRSDASNRVTTTIPPVPPVPPLPEGQACTVTAVTPTAVTITCPLVAPAPARYR